MKKVHIVMQGKGGVGKSMVASLLAQYIGSKVESGKNAAENLPVCIDTDPINATFAGFTSLKVRQLDIMKNDNIDQRAFDQIVDLVAETPPTQDFVIDTGGNSFISLANYLISNDVANLFDGIGRTLCIHSIITGGQALSDTVNGVDQVATKFQAPTQIVVWLNQFFGPIEYEGKKFEEMKIYEKIKNRISCIIKMAELKRETFGEDFAQLLKARRSFSDALDDPNLSIIIRQRLTIIRRKLFSQLDASGMV